MVEIEHYSYQGLFIESKNIASSLSYCILKYEKYIQLRCEHFFQKKHTIVRFTTCLKPALICLELFGRTLQIHTLDLIKSHDNVSQDTLTQESRK